MYAVAQWLRGLRPVRYLIVVCGRCGRLAFLRVPLLGCEKCPGYPPPELDAKGRLIWRKRDARASGNS